MGIGPEGQKVAGEIKSVSSSPEFAITGGLNALVQKAVFGQMTQSMIKGQWIQVQVNSALHHRCVFLSFCVFHNSDDSMIWPRNERIANWRFRN